MESQTIKNEVENGTCTLQEPVCNNPCNCRTVLAFIIRPQSYRKKMQSIASVT